MKIGIVSDTHRNKEYLQKVTEWLLRHQHIASLYHLGDDYDDVNILADEGLDVVQVPGIYDDRYLDRTLPAQVQETVLGIRIVLVHSIEKDFLARDMAVTDIVLHGHTHKAEIILEDGLLKMNPGHLKSQRDKNMEPSFGFLDIGNREINATIFNLSFKPVQTMHVLRAENGLYKA